MCRLYASSIIVAVLWLTPAGLLAAEHKNAEEVWEQQLGDQFKIDASTQGLQQVNLRCGADSMLVELETDHDFGGVMYTRGSFHQGLAPCFVRPDPHTQMTRSLKMKFNLDECHTQKDGELFSNVVVVQHDPDLVTPGDAAFSVECDFRRPKTFTTTAEMAARDRVAIGSRITLTSPDPSASVTGTSGTVEKTVFSKTDSVTFMPDEKRQKRGRGTVEHVPLGRDEL